MEKIRPDKGDAVSETPAKKKNRSTKYRGTSGKKIVEMPIDTGKESGIE
jgi:hypothetical protein